MCPKWKMDPPKEINFSKISKFWATLGHSIQIPFSMTQPAWPCEANHSLPSWQVNETLRGVTANVLVLLHYAIHLSITNTSNCYFLNKILDVRVFRPLPEGGLFKFVHVLGLSTFSVPLCIMGGATTFACKSQRCRWAGLVYLIYHLLCPPLTGQHQIETQIISLHYLLLILHIGDKHFSIPWVI